MCIYQKFYYKIYFINNTKIYFFRDLTLKDGLVLEITNDYENFDEEEFGYSEDLPLTNEEALNLLNMNDFEDEDDCNDSNINKQITVCGISFEQLKTNMTDIFGNGKVNFFFYCSLYIVYCFFKKIMLFFNFN